MAMRYVLVEGDPLIGETGIILPVGRSSPTLLDIPIAFIGDMVQCFICGQVKPIEKDGGPYRVGIFSGDVDISIGDIFNATEEFAYEDDVIYCGCGKKPLQAMLAPVKLAKDEEDSPAAAALSGFIRELGEGWILVKDEAVNWATQVGDDARKTWNSLTSGDRKAEALGNVSKGVGRSFITDDPLLSNMNLSAQEAFDMQREADEMFGKPTEAYDQMFKPHDEQGQAEYRTGERAGTVGQIVAPFAAGKVNSFRAGATTAERVAINMVDDAEKAFDYSKYVLKEGEKLGDFGETVAKDMYKSQGYDTFYNVQNKSGNGVDVVAANSKNGNVVRAEVKTTQQDKLWNEGNTKPIPLSKEQRELGGEDYTNSRLDRAARSQNGYTDGVSSQQAKDAKDAIRDAIGNGAEVKTEKVDVYVDQAGNVRGDPVIREW